MYVLEMEVPLMKLIFAGCCHGRSGSEALPKFLTLELNLAVESECSTGCQSFRTSAFANVRSASLMQAIWTRGKMIVQTG
jgi:hypothetical protein